MIKNLFLVFTLIFILKANEQKFIARQGQITFFSYTTVENIEATNNQVLSIFNPESSEIAVSILMRAFNFEKALMHEHFNESYVESDLFPQATFEGTIINFDAKSEAIQTRLVKGNFTLKDITKEIEFKAQIARNKKQNSYIITGKIKLQRDDYNIKVPAMLRPNIAKNIEVSFNFQYEPYED
ncbi:MAG: YceI family protein [Bacteroidota bacterium]